jgi:dolichyl-phosphate-mannose-protein mannosyltransferase
MTQTEPQAVGPGSPARRGVLGASRRTISSLLSRTVIFTRAGDPPPTLPTDRGRVLAAALVPIVLFLGGVALRVVRRPPLNFDEHIFLDVGRHLIDTGLPLRQYAVPGPPTLFFDHTPLYVYFVALVTALGGPTPLILRSTTLVFGLLTVLLVFRIGLELRGPGSALVGSVLLAVNPFFVTYSWFVRMEVPLCFFLVLALYLMIHQRLFLAGLAIATAVMLKEIALAFWVVAVVYVLIRRGGRAAALVAIPTPIVFGAWLVYAADIGLARLLATMGRWFGSAAGSTSPDRRLHVGLRTWVNAIFDEVIGPVLVFATGATAALVATWRRPAPPIVLVPIAYTVLAVAASFLIRLKEPRFLIAIVPMTAVAIALLLDWDEIWAYVRRRARSQGPGSSARPDGDLTAEGDSR